MFLSVEPQLLEQLYRNAISPDIPGVNQRGASDVLFLGLDPEEDMVFIVVEVGVLDVGVRSGLVVFDKGDMSD